MSSDCCDVFQKDESGSNLTDEPHDFAIKAGALSVQAHAAACKTDILTRESAEHDIDCFGQCPPRKGADVFKDWSAVEPAVSHVMGEDGTAVGVNFAVGCCSNPGFEGERQSTDAAEEIEPIHAASPNNLAAR